MKLYNLPGACSFAVHLALRESGLPFSLVRHDPKTGTAGGRPMSEITKKGYSPALELVSGDILTEIPTLLQYIADQVPSKKLCPAFGSLERVRCQEWTNYISSEIHKSFGVLWDDAAPESYKALTIVRLKSKFDFLENILSGQRYLLGTLYSVADMYLYTVLSWTPKFNIDLRPWPTLNVYFSELNVKPSVVETIKAEQDQLNS